MATRDLTHDELTRIYGPWIARTPADVADLLDGYTGRWWIAGGWAIEAFTGAARQHDDVDPSIPLHELAQLRRHLAGRIDVWAAAQEVLQVLHPEDIGHDQLPPTCGNLWARRSGADPWEYDILLTPTEPDMWVFKRDDRIRMPIDAIVWRRDGISYLRPEIQLLHKARGLRDKDQADFDACWPLLDQQSRRWLREAVELTQPDHPWLSAM